MTLYKANNEMNEESLLIEKAKKDIRHFEALYNKYYEPIFRYIYRKTEDEDVTSDITSRVFMNAMNGLAKYQYKNVSFGAWLYKIATNETYKHFRSTKKRFLSLEDEKVNQFMICDDLENGEDKLAVLKQLIDELDEDEIKILELKFFENRNFEEIAFIMDKKESTIKMRLYRSLNKLKEKYQKIEK